MLLQHIFELIPVLLAVIAAGSCATSYHRDRRKHTRTAMLLAIVASVLLIVAQASWWTTRLYTHSLQGTEFANAIWTIFNSLTMVVYILMASPWRAQK